MRPVGTVMTYSIPTPDAKADTEGAYLPRRMSPQRWTASVARGRAPCTAGTRPSRQRQVTRGGSTASAGNTAVEGGRDDDRARLRSVA